MASGGVRLNGARGHPDDFFPLLVGAVERESASTLRFKGPRSGIRLRTEKQADWLRLLARLDGRSSLTQLSHHSDLSATDIRTVLDALVDAELLINAQAWWEAFHHASHNPRYPGPPVRGEASTIPRWRPPDTSRATRLDPTRLELPARDPEQPPSSRRSFPREALLSVDPCASETLALQLAHNSYLMVDGCRRPTASAGGLEPVHLLTIGAQAAGGDRRVLVTNDDGSTCYELGRLTSEELLDTLVPDDVILSVVRDGAAIILVCADPTRVVHKYGDRGWRYALMEAGAVSHHIALLASDASGLCRPVGGFLDRALAAYAFGLVPLLAMIVVVEPTGPDQTE
jgi:hypothetical protein